MDSSTNSSSKLAADFSKSLQSRYETLLKQKEAGKQTTLEMIDGFCESIALSLGNAIKENPSGLFNLDHIAWIWGQYRGTALSGKRELQDYFANDGLGTNEENDYLLEFYWQMYGIAASFGELFDRYVLTESRSPNRSVIHLVKWHALRVTLYDQQELRFTLPIIDNEIENESDLAYYDLTVPQDWIETVLPEWLFDKLKDEIKGIATGHNREEKEYAKNRKKSVENLLTQGQFRQYFIKTSNHLIAKILVQAIENKKASNLQAARSFLANMVNSDEEAIEIVVRAIQMFSLYWHWRKLHVGTGDLLVLTPMLINRIFRSMPRVGLAFAFTSNKECTSIEQVKRITGLLNNTLVLKLKELTQHWVKDGVSYNYEQAKNFLGDLANGIEEIVIQSLHGNDTDAKKLLTRILPVVREMSQLTPNFVHEGHRFKANIFLGLPYHEQILGHPLANLEISGDGINSLKYIIDSSYSLLDSEDIVLFGNISSAPNNTVEWTSLLKLNSLNLGSLNTAKYETITKGHGNLFAISVDERAKLQLFNGGKLLVEFSEGKWRSGTSTEERKKKLIERIKSHLQTKDVSDSDLDKFATIIQKISETPHAGALLIVTEDELGIDDKLFEISAPPEDIWKNKSINELLDDPSEIFFRLATMDGATVIYVPKDTTTDRRDGQEQDLRKSWSRTVIRPRRMVAAKFDLKAFEAEWPWVNWQECKVYGVRRASALALAMHSRIKEKNRSCLCIVVSADGPIYLMPGEEVPVERI